MQRMHVDIADAVDARHVLNSDRRFRHFRAFGRGLTRCSQSQLRRRGLAARCALLRRDHQIARLNVAAHDLGKAIVVEAEDDGNSRWLAVAKNPDLALIGLGS